MWSSTKKTLKNKSRNHPLTRASEFTFACSCSSFAIYWFFRHVFLVYILCLLMAVIARSVPGARHVAALR